MIKPLFSSHYSVGQSVLTLNKIADCKPNAPQSILQLAKSGDLKEVFVVDSSFTGFIEAYQNCKAENLSLRFGVKMIVCDDITKKDEESLKNESNIIIYILNTEGYKDLIKIYSKSWVEGMYYKNRIDWKNLKAMWTPNLGLAFPFYSSFLAKNLMTFANIIPDYSFTEPTFYVEDHGLPFDGLIKGAVEAYTKAVEPVHTVYYPSRAQFKAWMTFRCIHERSDLTKPELGDCSVDTFGFDSWKEKQ